MKNCKYEFDEFDTKILLSILDPKHKLNNYKEFVWKNLIYINDNNQDVSKKLKEFTQEEWDEFNRLNDKYCMIKFEDNKHFVPENIQKFLRNNGWYKMVDRIEKNKIKKDEYFGQQIWKKENEPLIELNIDYSPDEKHECLLWINSVLVSKFRIGNLKAAIKRIF